MDVQIHVFLTSVLAASEWSASRFSRFAHGEKIPGTRWIGGLTFRKASKYYQHGTHANLQRKHNSGIIQYIVF
jgi:hypothetical protein